MSDQVMILGSYFFLVDEDYPDDEAALVAYKAEASRSERRELLRQLQQILRETQFNHDSLASRLGAMNWPVPPSGPEGYAFVEWVVSQLP